jgi:hypothetical protein
MFIVSSSVAFASPAELGACKPASSSEEAQARREAEKANLSDAEVLARLIYSESLSSGYWRGRCSSAADDALLTGIGWGILNRVKKAGGGDAVYNTVFAKNQFRTSFSSAQKEVAGLGKITNPFAVSFLCPLRAQTYLDKGEKKTSADSLWNKTESIAGKILNTFKSDGIPAHYRGITNFFYPKSEFFGEMRPPWAKDPVPRKNKGYRDLLDVENPCVEFYSL